MSATGSVSEKIVVWHPFGQRSRIARVDLIEGYSTESDIPRILSVSTGIDRDVIFVDNVFDLADVTTRTAQKA